MTARNQRKEQINKIVYRYNLIFTILVLPVKIIRFPFFLGNEICLLIESMILNAVHKVRNRKMGKL